MGPGFPGPVASLLGPVGYQGFIQTCVGLALVTPYPIVVLHTALLSAVRVSPAPGRRFLSFGFPLSTLSVYYMINYPSIGRIDKVSHVSLAILYIVNHVIMCYNMG